MGSGLVDTLLRSDEPSVRWKVRVHVLGDDPGCTAARQLQREVRASPRVRRLLAGHDAMRPGTYAKWRGCHWVLASLADLGYPSGDRELIPLRDQMLGTWLAPRYFREMTLSASSRSTSSAVPVVAGRHRRCGSQQGNALLSVVRLGLDDGRAQQLVERLTHWQWPDGGWNCDRRPEAKSPSVYETLLPMRGLAAFAAAHDDIPAREAAARAAEVLLERRLLFRRSTGMLINAGWTRLRYPGYWHYDVLGALKELAEAGLLDDPRCQDGLALLAAKQLPGGGWAAEAKHYRVTDAAGSGVDYVGWGGVDHHRINEWVTTDALAVLTAASRLDG